MDRDRDWDRAVSLNKRVLNRYMYIAYLLGVKPLFDMGNLEHWKIQLLSLHIVKWVAINTQSCAYVCMC